MDRPTKPEIPVVGKSHEEIRTQLRVLEDQLRSLGLGVQASVVREIHNALDPPKLKGVMSEITASRVWVTRDLALWMGARLMEAAEIIEDLKDDAEITGSYANLEKAKDWLRTLGLA